MDMYPSNRRTRSPSRKPGLGLPVIRGSVSTGSRHSRKVRNVNLDGPNECQRIRSPRTSKRRLRKKRMRVITVALKIPRGARPRLRVRRGSGRGENIGFSLGLGSAWAKSQVRLLSGRLLSCALHRPAKAKHWLSLLPTDLERRPLEPTDLRQQTRLRTHSTHYSAPFCLLSSSRPSVRGKLREYRAGKMAVRGRKYPGAPSRIRIGQIGVPGRIDDTARSLVPA